MPSAMEPAKIRHRFVHALAALAFFGLMPAVYLTHMYRVALNTVASKGHVLEAGSRFLRDAGTRRLVCGSGPNTAHGSDSTLENDRMTLGQYLQLSDSFVSALDATARGGYSAEDALNFHHVFRLRLYLTENIRTLNHTSYAAMEHLQDILSAVDAACARRPEPRTETGVTRASIRPHLDAIRANLATMKTAYAQWQRTRPTFLAMVWALIVLEVVGYGCAFWLIVCYARERRRRRAGADSAGP